MQLPLQITLRGIAHSSALEALIREKAARLEKFHPRLISCRVVVEFAGGHKRQGKHYVARVQLKLPGGEIVVDREHHEDVQVALRDALHAARRKLAGR